MSEIVTFKHEKSFRNQAEKVFEKHKKKINEIIPTAEIHHVGSTAIPGSITKGDVDLHVRVEESDFSKAKEMLAQVYEINKGSTQTDYFCAFEEDEELLPVGIQLSIKGSELDFFWTVTLFLKDNDYFLNKYNKTKKQFEGQSMDAYRKAKSELFEEIFSSFEYREFVENFNN